MDKNEPHCSKCEYCKCVEVLYKSFYCEAYENRSLSVDVIPSRTPNWCPLRGNNNEKE